MPKEKTEKTASLKTVSKWEKQYKCKLDCDIVGGKVIRMRWVESYISFNQTYGIKFKEVSNQKKHSIKKTTNKVSMRF